MPRVELCATGALWWLPGAVKVNRRLPIALLTRKRALFKRTLRRFAPTAAQPGAPNQQAFRSPASGLRNRRTTKM
eukprot:15444635-Alexandrium_andersonii.AAC.1